MAAIRQLLVAVMFLIGRMVENGGNVVKMAGERISTYKNGDVANKAHPHYIFELPSIYESLGVVN